jgi:hypothetical protein
MNTPTFPPQARFPAMLRPTSDFQAVRDGRSTGPLFVDIDLSTARSVAAGTALELNIAGNLIYFDQRPSSGVATLYLESDDRGMTPLTVFAGWKAQVPFTRVFIENGAQAGMSLRLVYGVDLDLDPGSGAGVTILNPITVTDQLTSAMVHYYFTGTVPVGNNFATVVIGGSNTPRGVNVKNVYLAGAAGAGGTITLGVLTYQFPGPSSFVTGGNQTYLAVLSNWTTTVQQLCLPMNRRTPPLWWIALFYSATTAVGSVECAVEYETL